MKNTLQDINVLLSLCLRTHLKGTCDVVQNVSKNNIEHLGRSSPATQIQES